MIRRATLLASAALALALAAPAGAAATEVPCELKPKSKCFGVEAIEASLSTTQAGAHPDLTFTFDMKKDPASKPNVFGLHDAYAPTRDVRFDLPPGLIGDPNVLGVAEQCRFAEMSTEKGCPNGSQVGVTTIYSYALTNTVVLPVYMMQPPGGDVVARLGFGIGAPIFIDLTVRSQSDYGVSAEIVDAPATEDLIRAETTTWGVPADPSHDTERCTVADAIWGCVTSPPNPPAPGSCPSSPTRPAAGRRSR